MENQIIGITLFLLVKSLYVPLNNRKSKYYWKVPIDDTIPLIPIFVVPYLAYFIYLFFSIVLLWNTQFSKALIWSLVWSYVIASIFWYIFPNGVKRPNIVYFGAWERILAWVYSIDKDTNGFPSAHVFVTVLCSYYLILSGVGAPFLWWTSATLITLSTLFTKQHYIVDLFGGVILAVISILVVG